MRLAASSSTATPVNRPPSGAVQRTDPREVGRIGVGERLVDEPGCLPVGLQRALSTIAFREKRNFQRVYIQQQKLWERWETSEPREPFSKRCVKRGKTPERGGQLLPCRFLLALHSAAVSTVWMVGLGVRPHEDWLRFGKQLSWSRGMRCGLLCQSVRSDST